MASIIVKLKARMESLARWMKQSYLFWIMAVIVVIWIITSYIYSVAEDDSFLNALFYILVLIFGEVSIDPQTTVGRIAALVILILGILLFAIVIGEMSNLLIQRFLNMDKVKVKRFYSGSDHVVVCGITPKLQGLLGELRSGDLERSSHAPIVILSENVEELRIKDKRLRRRVYGIKGDPLDQEILRRSGIARAKSIVIFTKEGEYTGKKVYRDSYASIVYKSIHNYLSRKSVSKQIKNDINVVIEFLDESINLLPCSGRPGMNRPEVYLDPIGRSSHSLIVEPIFMEKLSTYLLVQAVLQREIDEVIQRLLTTQIVGTNEFYYLPVDENINGKTFYSLEQAMLKTNATPIGVVRNYGSAMGRKACADGGNVELLINPSEEIILAKGDLVVTIAYDEVEAKTSAAALGGAQWKKKDKKALSSRRLASTFKLPFDRLFILNWDRSQVRDTLTELAKIYRNHILNSPKKASKRMPITIVTKHPVDRVRSEYGSIKKRIDAGAGGDIERYRDIDFFHARAPLSLRDLEKAGITASKAGRIRVLILAEEHEEEDPDLMTLYQSQLIENRVSKDIFTAVELNEFSNIHLFGQSFVDVIVSVDDFCEKLMAQAVLKPYISLIFRNLLTFSEDTNELYIRRVPKRWHNKPLMQLQEDLIGLPVIFIGHVRPQGKGKESIISVNPRLTGDYDKRSIRYHRLKMGDKIRPGDEIVLIAREPSIVDQVLAEG